jgi:two-component system nitrate/nitrite response regulator NarP
MQKQYGIRVLIATDATPMGEAWGEYLASNSVFPLKAERCSTDATSSHAILFRPHIIFLDFPKLKFHGLANFRKVRRGAPLAKIILIVNGAEPQAYLDSLLSCGIAGLLSWNSSLTHMMECIQPRTTLDAYASPSLRPPGWLEGPDVDPPCNRLFSLSDRELQIAQLMASGLTTKQIAAIAGIASGTVESHRHNILKKLGIARNVALVKLWAENNLPLHPGC